MIQMCPAAPQQTPIEFAKHGPRVRGVSPRKNGSSGRTRTYNPPVNSRFYRNHSIPLSTTQYEWNEAVRPESDNARVVPNPTRSYVEGAQKGAQLTTIVALSIGLVGVALARVGGARRSAIHY